MPHIDTDRDAFRRINAARRAVRDFDGRPLQASELDDILSAALLAPSSGNLQPFKLHVVQRPELKAAVAEACNNQRAAQTASVLIVVSSSVDVARTNLQQQIRDLDGLMLPPKSADYHRNTHKTLSGFLKFAPFPLWDTVLSVFALFRPVLSLLPFGSVGVRQWTARNSIFAAQTLMLAASAHGFDTCPMEGFSAPKIARLLDLPKGSVIPVVIALGHRRADALIEARIRRDLTEAVITH